MVQKEKKYITWEGLNQHAKNVGKKIKEYDAGVIGGDNGSFPLTAATKGNIYLLPATKKYYVCIENYNGSQLTAPNANFEELSVYTNRSKLDNLKGVTFKRMLPEISEGKRKIKVPNGPFAFAICRIRDISDSFYWSSHIMINARENWYSRVDGQNNLNYGMIHYDENLKIITLKREKSISSYGNNSEIDIIDFYYIN